MSGQSQRSRPPSNPLSKSQERIYSTQQLVVALKSSLAAVREQLSVLTILDSTAASWPGVQQATQDLEYLVDMSSQHSTRLEAESKEKDSELADVKAEVNTLKETLALQQAGKDDLSRQVSDLTKELRATTNKLDAANKENASQKQELWGLEKQRADLASETERVKQDNEFMEGEINTLRATVTEQMSQVTALKEDLAARKADVGHLKQLSADQKNQLDRLKRQLDEVTADLRDTRSNLSQCQVDKNHHEREADRLQEEVSRLGAEFNKTSKELERLKDWQEVLKKVEADKLREEQDGRMQERLAFETQKAALDKALSSAQAQLGHTNEKLQAKATEVENLKKQLGIAGVTSKGLQQEVAALGAEKAAMQRQRDDAQAQVAKLQAQVQASQIAGVQQEKKTALALGKAREEATAERARIKAVADDSAREAAVQKALAEGWARDLAALQERLREEQGKAASLQQRLDELTKEGADGKVDCVKNAASAESTIKMLQQQLEGQQSEMKKLQAEHNSEKKRLAKLVEALQRECNESAVEVGRLRAGDGPRLPSLKAPVTIQDELNNLKKMLGSFSSAADLNSTTQSTRLPAVH